MSLLDMVKGRLSLPVIGSPMFIISVPDLVVAQCTSGVIGAMPSLNARPAGQFEEWVAEIKERLAAHDARHPDRPAAPFAINLIVHKSNDRLEHDLRVVVKHEVPLVITSLGARPEVNQAVHVYFGSDRTKRWKDIWGAGQGIGAMKEVLPAAELVARFRREYHDARMRLGTGCALLNFAWQTMTECA